MKTTIEELIQQRKQNRIMLDIQWKALANIIMNGEAELHTLTVECTTGRKEHYIIKSFSFYKTKPNEIYRAKPELIQQHRAFLLKKYNGVIPYHYE